MPGNTLTIRAKIVLIIVGVSCAGLLMCALLVLLHQREGQRADALRSAEATALIVAEYAIGPLVFEDREGARMVLQKLSVDPRFLDASLLDHLGHVVATWTRRGRNVEPRATRFATTAFEAGPTIIVRVPVTHRGAQVGSLEMHVDTTALEAGMLRDAVHVLGVCGALIFLCTVMAVRLQRPITGPILELSLAMRRIRESGQLLERVRYTGQDELGELYAGYNAMLDTLRTRELERDQNAARLRALIAALPDTVFVLDENGRNVEVLATHSASASRKVSEPEKEVREHLLPEGPRAQISGALARAFARHEHQTLEYAVESPGQEQWFELHIVPLDIQTKSGQQVALCVRRDVSVQRALEAQALQSRKLEAVGQLAGGIAHDFNNLLAGIMGYAELVQVKAPNPDVQRYASEIVEIAGRAGELTSRLLAFSRKGKAHSNPMNMHEVIERVAAILRHTLDRSIELRMEAEARCPWVDGDQAQLESALLNLALNARDAMPRGGTLSFRTANTSEPPSGAPSEPHGLTPTSYLRIEVRDTGTGIPKSIQQRIFEPFFTTKAPGKGTGLGLSAVYGAVLAHQGVISVESVEGHGACFRIVLPVVTGRPSSTPGASTPRALASTGVVLVVDDEPALRETAKLCLEQAGLQVSLASNGREALDILRSQRNIDAVVLDVIMPEMGGVETLLEMRRIDPRLPVLMMSGYSPETSGSVSADGFLQKPFSHAELLARVTQLLALRRPELPSRSA